MRATSFLSSYIRLASVAAAAVVGLAQSAFGFTKSGITYTTDGSLADVTAAVANSTAGDIVRLPAGSFSWGAGGGFLAVNKAVTIAGAGPSQTTVTITVDASPGFSGVIRLEAAATIRDFKLNAPATSLVVFTASTSRWRISNITYLPTTGIGCYFIRTNGWYGLIDNCNITGAAGNDELIFTLGPSNSWQTPNSLGADDAVYIEDCIFNGPGYVTDANANSRVVVRYCTINDDMKVDGHGLASNGTRGVRQMEVYGNHWTELVGVGAWAAIELRGGTGMVFDNTADATDPIRANFFLTEYGYLGLYGGFLNTYQTPSNYPIGDQIGTGQDLTLAATAIPQYRLVRIATVGTTDFTSIGASNNNVGTSFLATGPGTGSGTVTYSPSTEPMYLWNNKKGGVAWTRTLKAVDTGAKTLYQTQSGISSFVESDIVKADRDFFADSGFDGTFTFNGNRGVGIGTKAQMLAITPTLAGVGFWVTDEADWNATHAGFDGQLYTWNGTAWVLKYTPFAYPHPARAPLAPSNLTITTP